MVALLPLGHDIGWLPDHAVKAPSTILTDETMLTDHLDEAGKCSAGPSSWRIDFSDGGRRNAPLHSGPQALRLMAPRLYSASTASPPSK
jgi:hypothetical protein